MDSNYHFEKEFEQIDFTKDATLYGDFEKCTFRNCNLNEIDLSDLKFIDCEFIDCNLSLVKLDETGFQQVVFRNCKMMGFNLETCSQFALQVTFDNCILNESSFYQLPLKRTKFTTCTLQHVDFSYADLSLSFFEACDLAYAIFDQTDLRQANLKSAYHFNINPNNNKIKGAIFSKDNVDGLLKDYGIKIEQ